MTKPTSVDEYINSYPEDIQALLQEVRQTIKKAVPDAEEVISYSMPAYKMNGMLVWFGGHTNHVGFYPGAAGIAAFKQQLAGYKSAKGSVQFPYNEPLPVGLITEIVAYRVKANMQKPVKSKRKVL